MVRRTGSIFKTTRHKAPPPETKAPAEFNTGFYVQTRERGQTSVKGTKLVVYDVECRTCKWKAEVHGTKTEAVAESRVHLVASPGCGWHQPGTKQKEARNGE